MPGSMPATSQLEWLSSTTAMIVLFWSRATRDLLRSFGWGIAALLRENAATKLPCLAARPIASIGPPSAAITLIKDVRLATAVAPTAQGGDHSLIFLGTWEMSNKKTFSKNSKGGYRHHDY